MSDSFDLDLLKEEYLQDNPPPEKPQRVWVNKLKGRPTKAGAQWIQDQFIWDRNWIAFVNRKLREWVFKESS